VSEAGAVQRATERVRWGAVVVGWAVAILTGIVFNLVFQAAHYGLFGGDSLTLSDTTALVTISMISGFLAHAAGGYAAGYRARGSGGLNGAMVAVLGTAAVVAAFVIVAAIALATAGALFGEGGPAAPVSMTGDLVARLAVTALVLFLVNLTGGYLGGKLGEIVPRRGEP
jgi:hypothetical protein